MLPLLNYLPIVPTGLSAYVPSYLKLLRTYVSSFFRCLCVYVFMCLHIFFLPTCLRALNYFVPTCVHFSRAYVPKTTHKIYWGSLLYLVLLFFFRIILPFILFETPKQTPVSRTAYLNSTLRGILISTGACTWDCACMRQ